MTFVLMKKGTLSPMNEKEDIIIGRNAVAEALKSGRTIDSILIARGERSGTLGKIVGECRERGIVVKEADARKLDFLCGHSNHQNGVHSGRTKHWREPRI